jgi:hypothetical protein
MHPILIATNRHNKGGKFMSTPKPALNNKFPSPQPD